MLEVYLGYVFLTVLCILLAKSFTHVCVLQDDSRVHVGMDNAGVGVGEIPRREDQNPWHRGVPSGVCAQLGVNTLCLLIGCNALMVGSLSRDLALETPYG